MEFPVRPGIVGHAQSFPSSFTTIVVFSSSSTSSIFPPTIACISFNVKSVPFAGHISWRVPSVLMICVIVVQDYVLYRIRHDIFFQQGAVCIFPGFPPYVPS